MEMIFCTKEAGNLIPVHLKSNESRLDGTSKLMFSEMKSFIDNCQSTFSTYFARRISSIRLVSPNRVPKCAETYLTDSRYLLNACVLEEILS